MGGKIGGTAVSAGLIARMVQGARYTVTGKAPENWFGLSQPVAPVAQEAAGRQWDYPVAINANYMPGAQEKLLGFQQLLCLADSYDLLRLAIETRKDQIARLKWQIKPKNQSDKSQAEKIQLLTDFFMTPDKQHSWSTWLRAILEDVLVIDAPCLYPRFKAGGKLYALDIDGWCHD